MDKKKGLFTLPSQEGHLEDTKKLLERFGADAIRDSDGTKLPDEIKDLPAQIYTTYFVARGYNEFAKKHMDLTQRMYLSSTFTLAKSDELKIDIMDGYFKDQVEPDYKHDPKQWWEVIDRTTGEVVDLDKWSYSEDNFVTVKNAKKYHEYSVNFLAKAIWDPTQMYNHITNDWGEKEKEIPFDIRYTECWDFVIETLRKWLKDNPKTDVVRFTTFFYHFTLVFNDKAKEKFVDWFGYSASVSPKALLEFEKEYGYRLRPEHIVDEGYYNNPFRIPTKEFLDYMDFQQRFVTKHAKMLVDEVHKAGKKAIMFLGDNWIGTEPFGKYFQNIGLDGVAGSVGGGVTLRLISDIPGIEIKEGRFLPYFFPDTFYEGNDPTIETLENWMTARRAMLQSPLNRMGYGGYLSLILPFEKFLDTVESIADEFRNIVLLFENHKVKKQAKIAVLNAWGKIRSWEPYMVAHAKWYPNCYSYMGVMESLSGMDVDVNFINFDDVLKEDLSQYDVIINSGAAYTAYSGGKYFLDEKIIVKLREYVYEGGSILGIGEPSAILNQGKYFQLRDVFGLDRELGFSQSTNKPELTVDSNHDLSREGLDFGELVPDIRPYSENLKILSMENHHIRAAVNKYGKGKAFYLNGLTYNLKNSNYLRDVIGYLSNSNGMKDFNSKDYRVEVMQLDDLDSAVIINNTLENIETEVNIFSKKYKCKLEPAQMKIVRRDSLNG